MRSLLFAIVLLFLALTGCTDPTRVHRPIDEPVQSKAETVKYEGITPKTRFRDIAFEVRNEKDTLLFKAERSCYDQKNDYIVVPTVPGISNWNYNDSINDGVFLVIPRDSVTLCRTVKNNAYYSRNHSLHNFVIGAVVGGAAFALISLPASVFISLMSSSDVVGKVVLGSAATGALLFGGLGAIIGLGNDPLIDEIRDGCGTYFTEGEEEAFLKSELCF